MSKRYLYSFTVWPEEGHWSRNIYLLFGNFTTRVEMEFDSTGFEIFKADLERQHLTLREVERVPYYPPEKVP